MFCSACGHALAPGQGFCPQCGRPIPPPAPPIPGFQIELSSYASKIRALSVVWFIYGAASAVLGFIGLVFANAFFAGRFGPWGRAPWGMMGPEFLGPAIMHFAWAFVIVRAGLALVAGWGLMHHAAWGRVVAIVAAILNILKFPFGTALGIWSLAMLLGYRNSTLYDQLPEDGD